MPPAADNPNMPPPSSPRQGKAWLIPGAIGALAGLVVGVLVGTFLLGGRGDLGTADGDADVVCGYVAYVGDEYVGDDPIDLEDPLLWQLQAIGPLAVAAGNADSRYQELGDLGSSLYSAINRVDTELLEQTLADMSDICSSL